MSAIAVIPARGGSKGIPKKNLVDLNGKPLLAHMIGHAVAAQSFEDIVVSTDDGEIAKVAAAYGASAPFLRPAELAGDLVPSYPVVQHAVLEMEARRGTRYEYVVLLQATSPLCRPEDIAACMAKLRDDAACASAIAITPVATHPFRMKRVVDGDRVINYIDQGFEDMRPRQVLPPVYRRAGSVYASRRAVVMDGNSLVGDPCRGVVVPAETAVDIDGPLDLELVRLLMARQSQ